jgi:hypothetical protein
MYVMPDNNDDATIDEQDAPANQSPLEDAEWLAEQYASGGDDGQGLTQAEIAELDGIVEYHDGPVTSSTVSYYMNKHGIETRMNVITDDRLDDREWLRDAYLGDDDGGTGEPMTMQEIADEIGCSDGTVMRRLHKFGIPIRRSSDSESDEG